MTSPRVLLLSYGMGALPGFVGEGHRRVGYVPTAMDNYHVPVEKLPDRAHLLGLGYEVVDVRLQQGDLEAVVDTLDVLYVAGGNTFHLLHEVRRSGLDRMLERRLAEGLAYVGVSAGSVIMGPDIAPVSVLDDPAEAPDLTSTKGLGYVPYVVVPHYRGQFFPPEPYEKARREYGGTYPLLFLRDDQALLVEDGAAQVVAT